MALFVPNPERESVEELIEELSVYLASRYRDAEDELIQEVAKRAIRDYQLAALLPTAPGGMGMTAAERRVRNRVLAELNAHRAASARELQAIAMQIVSDLRREDLANRIIGIAATEGEAAAAAALRFTGVFTPITGTSAQAVAMVALSLESRLEVLNQRLTRYPPDAYQRIVAMYSPNTLLGVTTSRVQQAAAVQRFLSEGITGFVDKANRRWTIGAYAEMAGRTTVNRAFNDAGIWRMGQSGVHLVTVVRGLDSCRKCADWAGAILSTDGSPSGPRILPHAASSGTVSVHVSGTVEEARAAGWGHPNCRCRLVAYSPGLTIPQDDTTYDEVAEKERAQQRAFEREIRSAKRREASAMTDTDRRKAAQDVRTAQADMRKFIRDTGRLRQSYREQLHFADGRGGVPRSPTTTVPNPPRPLIAADRVSARTLGDVRVSNRGAQTVPTGSFPRAHELATGDRLTRAGINVQWRVEDFTRGVKNPDVTIDGHVWDFKSPEGAGKNTISNQFSRAKEQGVRRLVIDLARSPLESTSALAEARRRLSGGDWFTDVIFIDQAGRITWLSKE
ncbi:phage minor capsid protein [Streptomyces sp. AC495_CC817]|uniref:phage minor capsid protein n=1 Tax=Streptomyces sp. AC495_CC817 TaxID=2823900 RepID=UPI001C27DC0E|nr:phage minor capsid protein [Streptomyces sp. AC495_CC817]